MSEARSEVGEERVGFIGLGHMGEPMALRLARHGTALTVWTRTAGKVGAAVAAGATAASSPTAVFERSDVVVLMLAHETAVDAVLGRSGSGFGVPVAGRTVVNMGTVAPSYSVGLSARLAAHGARYVEAPVSGSRVPAENGELVVMLAGEPDDVARTEPLLAPLASGTFRCGAVPNALELKLAVNVFLIAMVTGLAETVDFAARRQLDLELLRRILDAGPMSSAVSRVKLAKCLAADLTAQASVGNVHDNTRLILDAAAEVGLPMPLLTTCEELYAETEALGLATSDMIAVVEAIRARGR